MSSTTAIKSSAIASISDVYDENMVNIVFTSSNKVYSYVIDDVNAWETELQDTIDEEESVGSYVNRAIRSGLLKEVN